MNPWVGALGVLVAALVTGAFVIYRERLAARQVLAKDHAERVRAAAAEFLAVISAAEHFAWVLVTEPRSKAVQKRLDDLHEERRLKQLRLALETDFVDVRVHSREMRTHIFHYVEAARAWDAPPASWPEGVSALAQLRESRRHLLEALATELGITDLYTGIDD